MNLLNRKPDVSPFPALVAERVAVEKEFRTLNTPAACKLTAEAMLREAMAVARTTPERLAKLGSELDAGKPGADGAMASLRRMEIFVRSPGCGRPPRELRRLNFLLTGDAVAELAAIGSSTFELFTLAVQRAGERHPQDFGECQDSAAFDRRLIELVARRDELDRQIAGAWGPEDLDIGEFDGDGRALLTFKVTGGKVPVAPSANAGERLVNWMLANGTA